MFTCNSKLEQCCYHTFKAIVITPTWVLVKHSSKKAQMLSPPSHSDLNHIPKLWHLWSVAGGENTGPHWHVKSRKCSQNKAVQCNEGELIMQQMSKSILIWGDWNKKLSDKQTLLFYDMIPWIQCKRWWKPIVLTRIKLEWVNTCLLSENRENITFYALSNC